MARPDDLCPAISPGQDGPGKECMVKGHTADRRIHSPFEPPPARAAPGSIRASAFAGLLLVVVGVSSAALAAPALWDALTTEDPEQIAASVEEIIEHSETTPAAELFLAAAAALDYVGTREAAFLYHAGLLRTRIDLTLFPPAAGQNPEPGLARLSYQVGMTVDPIVTDDPAGFADLAARLENWQPSFPPDYSPGWVYQAEVKGPTRDALARRRTTAYLAGIQSLAALFEDPDYRAAVATVRARNFGERAVDRWEYEAAVAVMQRIESEAGVRGYAPAAY